MEHVYDINFIASAINTSSTNYEDFLIPYVFFSLSYNKNAFVEIIVENPEQFKNCYKAEINAMRKLFRDNFGIRKHKYPLNPFIIPNFYRFLETPTVKSKYVYIADIDIMFLEEILPIYLQNWPKDLPYNNAIRLEKVQRLTGVHLIKTKEYYTDNLLAAQEKIYYHAVASVNNSIQQDEVELTNLCKSIHGLPDCNHNFRPILGIHFSPNRGKEIQYAISNTTTQEYKNKFITIMKTNSELFDFKCFNTLYINLIENFKID